MIHLCHDVHVLKYIYNTQKQADLTWSAGGENTVITIWLIWCDTTYLCVLKTCKTINQMYVLVSLRCCDAVIQSSRPVDDVSVTVHLLLRPACPEENCSSTVSCRASKRDWTRAQVSSHCVKHNSASSVTLVEKCFSSVAYCCSKTQVWFKLHVTFAFKTIQN